MHDCDSGVFSLGRARQSNKYSSQIWRIPSVPHSEIFVCVAKRQHCTLLLLSSHRILDLQIMNFPMLVGICWTDIPCIYLGGFNSVRENIISFQIISAFTTVPSYGLFVVCALFWHCKIFCRGRLFLQRIS